MTATGTAINGRLLRHERADQGREEPADEDLAGAADVEQAPP